MKTKRNIFHIGLFHAASTTLQQGVFPYIPDYNFVNFKKAHETQSGPMPHMPKNFGKYFYYEKKNIFKDFKKYKKPFIFSSESISNLQEQNSYFEIKYRNENPIIGMTNLAKFMSESNSHLLFIIRDQKTIINSYFKRWSHLYKSENDLFIDFPYKKNMHKSKRTLKYSNFGMLYSRTFNYRLNLSIILNFINKNKVHIIPFEYLLEDQNKFIKLLGNAFGKDLNFLKKNLSENKYNESPKFNKGLSKNFLKQIHNEFSNDNKILDKTFNLGLKKLGYY